MNYTSQYGSSDIVGQLFLGIIIAAIAYGAFPMIFALCKPKISTKRYRWLCFLVNFVVFLCFALIGGNYNAAPYLLWTVIFCAIFKRFLPKIDPPIDYSKFDKKSFDEVSSSVPEEVLAQCESHRGSREGITKAAEAFAKEGVIPYEYVPALVEEYMKPVVKQQAVEEPENPIEEPIEEPAEPRIEEETSVCYCRFCGAEIAKEDKFCRSCGAEQKSAKAPASEPQKAVSEKSMDYRAFIAIGAIVLLILVAVAVIVGMVGRSGKAVPTPAPTPIPTPEPTLTRYAMPLNGHVFINPDYDCVCPFSFSGEPGTSYYVYLEYQYAPSNSYHDRYESTTNPTEGDIAFFVRPGYSVDIDVPIGVYKLYYAMGNGWYGHKDLFGKDTIYCTSDDLLEFYTDYNTAYGMFINLWVQDDGTFETEYISASQFPG